MEIAALSISLIALIVTSLDYNRARKESRNQFIRLVILTKSIRHDLESLHFNFKLMHLIPGTIHDKEAENHFFARLGSVKSKLESFYELLILDKKIGNIDLRQIFTSLTTIEDNLTELANYPIENMEDLETAKSFISPIGKELEVIERIVQEYDTI